MKNISLILFFTIGMCSNVLGIYGVEFFSAGIMYSSDQFALSDTLPPYVPEIYKVVEEMPRFPGCEEITDKYERKKCSDKKLMEFVKKNMQYPSIAVENKIEGMAVIQFVVDEKGWIKHPVILKNVAGGCGKEALRIVKLMNGMSERWVPGKQRGKPVKVYFNLPIRFSLNDISQLSQKESIPEIFHVVPEMPRFPGCEDISNQIEKQRCSEAKMLEFVYKNIKYPMTAIENKIEGTVVVQFVVSDDGWIEDITIRRGLSGGCTEEARRVVQLMQKDQMSIQWEPGKNGQEGRRHSVHVKYSLPVRFNLSELDKKIDIDKINIHRKKDTHTIFFKAPRGALKVKVTNVYGIPIEEYSISKFNGKYKRKIKHLPLGWYYVEVEQNEKTYHQEFLVK